MLAFKLISAFAAMAFGAAVVVMLPGFSPEADAGTPAPVLKSDRLEFNSGKDCTQQAWPYYDADCLRADSAASGNSARPVRVVTTDRVSR